MKLRTAFAARRRIVYFVFLDGQYLDGLHLRPLADDERHGNRARPSGPLHRPRYPPAYEHMRIASQYVL